MRQTQEAHLSVQEESCWSQHNSFHCCLLSSPVFQQPRTHFARSSALLNVLWQHLVEQGKNCTAPWRELLCLLISLLGKAFWRQKFEAAGAGGTIRVPASGLASTLCWANFCCFPFSFTKQKTNTAVLSRAFLLG